MQKKVIQKEDGRYLIFFSFSEDDFACDEREEDRENISENQEKERLAPQDV